MEFMIVGPIVEMRFIILVTRLSFPGITLAEYRSVSVSCSLSVWLASKDAMFSADRSSPCAVNIRQKLGVSSLVSSCRRPSADL